MRRAWRTLTVVAGSVIVALAFLGNATFRDRLLALETPDARLARLSPHWRLIQPEEAGDSVSKPLPVAILLSGCDGPGDSMDFWAETLADAGWASLVLDSHEPRGLDRLQAWRLVCSGQALSGAERAGDVAVALASLDGMAELDGHRVVLLGASHGAWAAMELVDRLGSKTPPPGLSTWPEPYEAALDRLQGMVLLYPYCGPLNQATRGTPMNGALPVLMVLAGEDTIVSTSRCEAVAARLNHASNAVRIKTLPGVDHGFDQHVHAAFSTLDFDPEATDAATRLVIRFLAALPIARERVE